MSALDVVRGVTSLDHALPKYIEAEKMYDGTAEELFASSSVSRAIAKTGEVGKVNLVKRITTTVANRLKLASVSVPNSDPDTEQLTQIRDANDMDVYEKLLIRKTLMYGDAYFSVWNVNEDDMDEDEDMRQAGVSLNYNSPLCMRMIYDPINERRALYAIKVWKHGDVRRADLYYRTHVERWITKDKNLNGHEPEHWVTYDELIFDEILGDYTSDNGVIYHDFNEIPVVHFRTDLTYGSPEAIDGYSMQRAINKALVTLVATIERSGFPVRYMLMQPEALLDNTSGEDPDWDLDESADSATSKSVPPASASKDVPGTAKELHGVKDVKEFSPADPNVFLAPVMDFVKLMALATETPAYELNPSGDQPSGEARRQADKPLEAKVADRQVFLKGPFANLYRLALKAVGTVVKTVEIQWAPTSPINDAEGWATVSAKQSAGVPVGQTLAEAGYSQDQIDEWLDNIAEATTLDQKVETLGKIATAMKDLGTAVTLQVISAEQVNLIVDSLIESFGVEVPEEVE